MCRTPMKRASRAPAQITDQRAANKRMKDCGEPMIANHKKSSRKTHGHDRPPNVRMGSVIASRVG